MNRFPKLGISKRPGFHQLATKIHQIGRNRQNSDGTANSCDDESQVDPVTVLRARRMLAALERGGINAAAIHSDEIAHRLQGVPRTT